MIEQLVTERISSRNGVDEFLRDRSKPIPNSVAEILQVLYPTRPLICAAYDWTTALTRPLDWFITPRPDKGGNAPENFQFIVPSPMLAPYWIDEKGRHHARGNANVGPRRFLVTDFDIKAGQHIYASLIDKWAQAGITIQAATAALIDYLAEAGPLVMVVWSGNISLQAWWYCQGESEAVSGQMRGFFESAVILGADPAGWTKSQPFRMPGAQRVGTGRRQAVIYFNPDSIDEKDSQSSQDQKPRPRKLSALVADSAAGFQKKPELPGLKPLARMASTRNLVKAIPLPGTHLNRSIMTIPCSGIAIYAVPEACS